MTDGIHKVPKRGSRVRNQPRILGAKPVPDPGDAKILDNKTRSRPVEIQTKKDDEFVSVRSHFRSKSRKVEDA